ncbi:hypothetical protein [Ahrensia marina]|uniref:Uncharacterized protein n=1 Tax=Ahrensia marina TaxID=1514904 RepID=A0A0N0VLI1_9HYPH|nr:hypothetical protein [Ahrensia marina]KPB01361.1 hypothetical protein SU32_08915 [Ahrensia marina]
MRNRIAAIVGILGITLTSNYVNAGEQLSGAELKNFVSGKRVYLKIRLGGEFPLEYRSNGQVTGDGTKTGLGKYFAPKETGKWFVDGEKLCQQFPTWYKGRVSCFTIEKTGQTTLNWTRDDGYSGTARISG